jgi:hypothetical protein
VPTVSAGRRIAGLNARQRDLLQEREQAGQCTIGRLEYEQRYNVTTPTAGQDLVQLVKLGLMEQVGGGWQTRYRYIPRGTPTATNTDTVAHNQADEEMRR